MSRRHPSLPATSPTDGETAFDNGGPDGYRVIRTLGIGSRSRVYLAHTDPECAEPPVALKVFATDLADDDIDLEVCALERVDSLHVVRLRDISASPGATGCLILERLEGGTLAALLRDRAWIRVGEAVTILVSLFRGIRDLHDAGFAHNSLGLSSVLFDRAGRPVIIGLGHTSRLETSAGGAAQRAGVLRDATHADWERYRTIAQAVLDHVEAESRRNEVAAISTGLDRLVDFGLVGVQGLDAESFEDLLFALDQPAPVVLRSAVDVSASRNAPQVRRDSATGGARAEAVTVPVGDVKPAHRRSRQLRHEPQETRGSVAARVEAVLDAGPIRTFGAQLAPILRRRKKPLVFACIIAGIIAITTLAVIPPESGRAQSDRAHTTSGLTTARPAPVATTPAAPTAQVNDDPVEATMALLKKRTRCLQSSSRSCIDAVDQPDSAQQAADRELLRPGASPTPDSFIDYSNFEVSLTQRTGDSALVELTGVNRGTTQPASALIIKGEAGWRIREIFQN